MSRVRCAGTTARGSELTAGKAIEGPALEIQTIAGQGGAAFGVRGVPDLRCEVHEAAGGVVGGAGAYTSTAEGKIIASSYLDNYNNVITAIKADQTISFGANPGPLPSDSLRRVFIEIMGACRAITGAGMATARVTAARVTRALSIVLARTIAAMMLLTSGALPASPRRLRA